MVPGWSRGGYRVVPGWVVEELRFLHPHLRPISMDFKNASIDMAARNGRSFFENEHFRIISRILAVSEKKDKNNKVSIDELKKSPRRSDVFSLKKRLCFWRERHFPGECGSPASTEEGNDFARVR